MQGESYFLAFGGLGLSLAGFAGLIAALNPTGATAAVTAYRLRTIVVLGLSLVFVGFGAVAVYSITAGDLGTTVRVATLLMLVPFVRGLVIDTRPGPVWTVDGERRFSIGVLVVLLALTAGNLVVANVGYLEVLMLLGLIGPVSIFYNTIRDATGGSAVTSPGPRDDAGRSQGRSRARDPVASPAAGVTPPGSGASESGLPEGH
jgi:hypothetical protein